MLCYITLSVLLILLVLVLPWKMLHEKNLNFLETKGGVRENILYPSAIPDLRFRIHHYSRPWHNILRTVLIHNVYCTRCLYNLDSTDSLHKLSSTGRLRLCCTCLMHIWFLIFFFGVKSVCTGSLGGICATLFVTPPSYCNGGFPSADPQGGSRSLNEIASWYLPGHGCLSLVSVVCYQV